MGPDPKLVERVRRHGQEHLFAWWSSLTAGQQASLEAEVEALDFEQLDRLIEELVHGEAATQAELGRVEPIEVIRPPRPTASA